MRYFWIIFLLSIAGITGVVQSANAQNPTSSFGSGKSFDENDPGGLVSLSYHYSFGEESSPTAYFALIDEQTGEYLEEFSFLLGSGFGYGRARYLRKQGYSFVKSNTHFITRRFDPGTYVLVGARRGISKYVSSAYQDMSRATFAFTVEAGKVNYLGDFSWGSRSRTLCSLSRGEYDEDPTGYKNDDEGLCYAKFRNEDNAAAKARERAEKNTDSETSDDASSPAPKNNNAAKIIYATATNKGLADNNRIYRQAAETRIALMRSYLDKYRKKVSKEVEIIFPERVDVTLTRNVALQLEEQLNDQGSNPEVEPGVNQSAPENDNKDL